MLGKFEWNANSNKACIVYIQYKCFVYICIPLVEEVLAQKLQVDSYGEIVKLAKGGYCWKEHLCHLESGLSPWPCDHHLCYLRWPGWTVVGIQFVPKEPHSFQRRLPLLEPWQSPQNEAMGHASGIPDCISCFLGGHWTWEGTLSMACATLAQCLCLPQIP